MVLRICRIALLAFGLILPLLLNVSNAQDGNSAANTDMASVSGIRVTSTALRARVIIDLSDKTPFSFVSLGTPNRIAVDVRAGGYDGASAAQAAGTGLILKFSVEQIGPDRLRTNLMLTQSAQVQQAYFLEPFDGQPARLVVDIIKASDDVFAQIVARDKAATAGDEQVAAALTQIGDAPGASRIETTSRPLILIDPGHGGVDGGATAQGGTREKEITLLFAQQLQDVLIASGRFDVALTRDGDDFMRLEERVQLARENRADLLISVHADSFEDQDIRGASVYIRDEQATDVLDKVLAENENKADLLAGFLPDADEPAVVNILVDLMRREMRRQSFIAASAIVEQLRPSVRVRRFPLRRADFFVLQSPDVPAILVELGFLSNSSDSQNLTSADWRQRMAEAVARGVALFFDGAR